ECGLASSHEDDSADDARDYSVDYYVRLLRTTYAQRLARAFTPLDFTTVFADADQFSIFEPPIESVRTVLTTSTATSMLSPGSPTAT
ncbi:MAG TPA: hypothetical protein VLI40_13590, partial [Gemmatimonadaceae bacterium]|nr:hypothetical protein [Gemmatimonadaceae bacterium]